MSRRLIRGAFGVAGLSALTALVAVAPVQGATLTVSNTNDAGAGSLRQAIATANTTAEADSIQFVAGISGQITLTTGELVIASDMDIRGPGARLVTVSGNDASRVFLIQPGATATIAGLTVANGSVSGGSGGAATATGGAGGAGGAGGPGLPGAPGAFGVNGTATGGAGGAGRGGGIANLGVLTLDEVEVRNNAARAGNGGDATASGGDGGPGGAGGNSNAANDGGPGGAGGDGGGATATGGVGGEAQGGGIYNGGALTVLNSTVRNNRALPGNGGNATATGGAGGEGGAGGTGGPGATDIGGTGGTGGRGGVAGATGGAGGNARGAGIYNAGTFTIANSTVSANAATSGQPGAQAATGGPGGNGGAGGANGGGVGGSGGTGGAGAAANATAGARGAGQGGGIFNDASASQARLTSVTLASNSAPSAANLDSRVSATLQNVIVSDPQGGGQSCEGTVTSGGFNIDRGTSCSFGQPTDRSQTDPLLGVLQGNGGPTNTHALEPASPAIDQGISAGLTRDQRGVRRPSDQREIADAAGGDGADIGAFEVADTTTPNTIITKAPKKKLRKPSAKFKFKSDEPGSTFECQLRGKKAKKKLKQFAPCSSPAKYRKLKPGRYKFRVRAVDPTGNVDFTPAKNRFKRIP